ncbi:uncharacterized protein LOC112451027 [Kryptolebias marmoratus]|uniref:uncharacterized protein LOC112451027 n=1 Tax=Kryptolebias marmoratus TaxID=37003 RepID=UPI000D5307BC|nr:uncharacterized protein LOC112451027 [Kryptolebias marmoratus]
MNWVGGSRNRLVMKNDAKKQREFFEKRKMQQRLEKLGFSLPSSSPAGAGCGSTDLMNLFIVNQIATKKENKDPPKVSVLGGFRGGSRRRGNEPLVLPMSPCSPSRLSLVGSPPQRRVQETGKRKNVVPLKLKCQQLSPVVESAFSDNSASDYLPPATEPLSPASSGSSGRAGIFPPQLLPRYSPSPWETPGLHQKQFQLFSQPRGMTDSLSWSGKPKPPPFRLERPAARVLFGSPEPGQTDVKNGVADAFFLDRPEESEPALNFPLHLSDTERPFEEDVFRRFAGVDYETEGFDDGNPKSKIYLTDEASVGRSTPQIVPAQNTGSELLDGTDVKSSCLAQNTEPLNGCEHSPTCSCKAGYLGSDSSDDESCCETCLQASAFYADEPRCEPGPRSPPLGSKTNPGDDRMIEAQTRASGRPTAPPAPPRSRQPCGCRRTPAETRDAGTQTLSGCAAGARDASTQCESEADVPERRSEPGPQRNASAAERWTPWSEFTASSPTGESSRLIKAAPDGGGQEVRGHQLSEEAETLQEIADILLLLKQRKEKVDRQTDRK